jgi:hypothetical protein
MQDDRRISVLVLYTHPLLGEGIARLLEGEPGLDVFPVPTQDVEAVERGLASAPDVIIVERGDPDRAIGILEFVPDALIIDVGIDPGPTFTYQREEISARPDVILEAIQSLRSGRPARTPVPAASSGRVVGS